ncbi:MAG: ABC transporter transmembrane domain-containing protein [Gammaproteobacteria bacterium]|nr:ABC transporter transmembrane domain-containing protein [Gammaproteobacteria bacterium]MDE0253023.1 ABC transporter transmembrane domain-containing protein [Gammaproteobacteria bacterium]MDE0402333.1 ABC transporter transmembrane domain-containing protein [Gammaproteobacteria bacterium]
MNDSSNPSSKDWLTYRRLATYVQSRIWYFVVAIIAFGLAALAEVFFAQILGAVVDSFKNEQPVDASIPAQWYWLPGYFLQYFDWPLALLFAGMIGLAAIVRAFSNVVGEFLLSRVSFHVVHTIRCELHAQMLTLPCSYFDSSRQGDISNRLTDTTAKLRDTATDVFKILFQDGGKLVFMLTAMLLMNLYLTLLFLILAPIVAVIVHIASKRFRKISVNIQTSMGEVTHVGNETVALQKTIRAYNAQDQQHQTFDTASELNRRQHLKMIATKAMSAQFIQLLVAFAIAAVVGILFMNQISQGMEPGQLVTYVGLAGALANPIKRLSDVNARIQIGLAAATEIFEHIDTESETDKGIEQLQGISGAIEFNGVGFHYSRTSKQVLHDITLSVEVGKTVAIVGSTGAGKSTLAQLLLRFYEPSEGEILIDGVSISRYSKSSLRNQIAVVSQDVMLFSDTIQANMALGSLRQKDKGAIEHAAKRARVNIFSDLLPAGLNTNVGDRGSTLSQGEKQRVLIARAILKDAPILILDEATSSLDTESERLIQLALEEIMQDRTTLVIAHRLSTIMRADSIAVMEEGRIVEQGTHEELLRRQGRYALLYESQAQGNE